MGSHRCGSEANRGIRARVRAAGKAPEEDDRQTDNPSIIVRGDLGASPWPWGPP